MRKNWTKMKEDMEDELVRRIGEMKAERAESGAIRSRNRTGAVLGHIIFWVAIIGGSIALFELLRK